jgi:multidrug efflux system outer membrane protein
MLRNAIIFVVIIFCLTGCSLAPKYARPQAPTPSVWPSGPAYKGVVSNPNEPAPADIPWRDFYTDPNLQKVIELALANNRDLRVAAFNIEKTRALYQIQGADLFPAVGVSATHSRERIPPKASSTGRATISEQFTVDLGFSYYELDLFGRIRSLKEQALKEYLATEQARRSFQISLVAEVANAYLKLAADRDHLKFAQDTLDAQQASYDIIHHRYEKGTSSELDLRQAQTRVDASRVDIAKYTGLTAQDKNILILLVGSEVPQEILPNNLNTVAAMKDITAGLPSEMLQRRPDILEAENKLMAANANIGAARAAFFPRITLTTGVGTTGTQLSDLFSSGSGSWLFMPQITMPIFEGDRIAANLKVSRANRKIALAQYEKAIQAAFREVADALAERGTVGDQLAAQQSLVDAAAESYRLSESRYLSGIDSHLTVLDSQRSLYAAQHDLITLRLARMTNLLTLYKTLGYGWSGDDAKITERAMNPVPKQ